MPTITFTKHLQRFFPDLHEMEISGASVAEIIAELNRSYPGIADYIVDDQGALRKHVNIFVGEELIRDRTHLSDPLAPGDRVVVLQALSGG